MTSAVLSSSSAPSKSDPYSYQSGFGNRFASEAVPGVLPRGQNCPQRVKYDLFSEQLNGSGFISSRSTLQNVWMYRIRPSVAHKEIIKTDINPKVCFLSL
jgi:homogentisate 1,2-dioxygenase